MSYTDAQIAQVCHEANRALQVINGEEPSPHWPGAPRWQRTSAVEGIQHALAGQTPEQLHRSWCEAKRRDGWAYGPVKDAAAKTHPCLVPYGELPAEQRYKDQLFAAVVAALAPVIVTRDDLVGQIVMHSIRGDGNTTCGMDREALPSGHVAVASGANCQDCAAANERGEQIREQYLGPRDSDAIRAAHNADGKILYGSELGQLPTVGRIVHYVSHGTPFREDGTQAYPARCRAAIVTEAQGYGAGLCVLNPEGQFFNRDVPADPGTYSGPEREAKPGEPLPLIGCDDLTYQGGTWHWPAS